MPFIKALRNVLNILKLYYTLYFKQSVRLINRLNTNSVGFFCISAGGLLFRLVISFIYHVVAEVL